MPNVDWNLTAWNSQYDWKGQGEEWSDCWGSSFSQWLTTIYPRIGCFFPAAAVLEIAPGFGRWTRFLVQGSQIYRGVDISEKCVEACKSRFSGIHHAKFYVNDGKDLSQVNDTRYDFVFSFDSLVHVDIDVLTGYIKQIISLLSPNGVAFLHHSNLGIYAQDAVNNPHWRSTNVTAAKVEKIIGEAGGDLLTQEILTWGENYVLNDCFSLFSKAGAFPGMKARKLVSKTFMEEEVARARNIVANYHINAGGK